MKHWIITFDDPVEADDQQEALARFQDRLNGGLSSFDFSAEEEED